MSNLPLSIRFWISLFLGIPILALGIGVLIYVIVGPESSIWEIASTIGPVASALATMSLAFAALIGLLTNIRMASEMEKTRKAQTAPSIIAYFDNPTSILIDLVIKNIGYGAAKEVCLKISPPLLDFKNKDINELSLFKSGIKFFPPNREFRQTVGTGHHFFSNSAKRPLEYKLTISYQDTEGNPLPDQIISLDISVYRNLPIHRESEIAEAIKEVSKSIMNKR